MKRISFIIMLSMLSGLFFGQGHQSMKSPVPATEITKAVCVISATSGNTVSGVVTFTKVPGGMKIVADLEGLTPGKHGFHVHEKGDCSAPDGSSAGGHFNPTAKTHGAPMDMSSHEGDMGNLEADASGKAHLEFTNPVMTFKGDQSIIGKSVIVHKDADDLKTQPTGNSGARIGCGVIVKG